MKEFFSNLLDDIFSEDLFTKENIYIGIGVIAGIFLLFILLLFIQWKRAAKRKAHPKTEDYTLVSKNAVDEAKANLKNGLIQSFRAEFGDNVPADQKALHQYILSVLAQRNGSPYVSVANLIPFLKNLPGVFLQGTDSVGGAYVLPVVMSESGEKSFRMEGLIFIFKKANYQYSETWHLRIRADKVGQPIEEVLEFES